MLNNVFILAFKNSITEGRKVKIRIFIFETEGELKVKVIWNRLLKEAKNSLALDVLRNIFLESLNQIKYTEVNMGF